MRCVTESGRDASLEPTPRQRAAFGHELDLHWAGDNAARLRALAAHELYQAGWTVREIAIAQRIDPGAVTRAIHRAAAGLASVRIPPTDHDLRDLTQPA